MTDRITARDLMRTSFASVGTDVSVHKAMRLLAELIPDPGFPNALVVLDTDQKYKGLLTARLLFRSLLAIWMPGKTVRDNPKALQNDLIDLIEDRAEMRVHDVLLRGLPTATPGDRLLTLIDNMCDKQMEFLAVVEDGHPVGLVPLTEVFNAAAALALTPEDEGIQFDQEDSGGLSH